MNFGRSAIKVGIVFLACVAAASVALPSLAQDTTRGRPSTAVIPHSEVSETSNDRVDWPKVGTGFSTAVGNLFYIPAKIAYGTLGGLAGGAAYVFTRGDHHVAHEIWRNSLGGDYVLTPTMLKGQEPIHFVGDGQDRAQAADKASQHSARIVQLAPLQREASVSAATIEKRSDSAELTARKGSSANLEIPRAEYPIGSAELNPHPQGTRSNLPNQESMPQFSVVPE